MNNEALYSLDEVTRAVRLSKHTFLRVLKESDNAEAVGVDRKIPAPVVIPSQMNGVKRYWTKEQFDEIVSVFQGGVDITPPQVPHVDAVVGSVMKELTAHSVYMSHTGVHDYGLSIPETEDFLRSILIQFCGRMMNNEYYEVAGGMMRERLYDRLMVQDVIHSHEFNTPPPEQIVDAKREESLAAVQTIPDVEIQPKQYTFYHRGDNFGNLCWVVENGERQVYCGSNTASAKIISLAQWFENGSQGSKPLRHKLLEAKAFYLVFGEKQEAPIEDPVRPRKRRKGKVKIQTETGAMPETAPVRKRGRPKGSNKKQLGAINESPPTTDLPTEVQKSKRMSRTERLLLKAKAREEKRASREAAKAALEAEKREKREARERAKADRSAVAELRRKYVNTKAGQLANAMNTAKTDREIDETLANFNLDWDAIEREDPTEGKRLLILANGHRVKYNEEKSMWLVVE